MMITYNEQFHNESWEIADYSGFSLLELDEEGGGWD